jgi:hypothetical protein
VISDRRYIIPPKLATLVQVYDGQDQDGVRFRLPSWITALDGVSGDPTRLLTDTRSRPNRSISGTGTLVIGSSPVMS